MPVGVYRFTLK